MSNDNPSITSTIDELNLRILATLRLGSRPSTYCTEVWVGLRTGLNGYG
jgi:hypothetical protein